MNVQLVMVDVNKFVKIHTDHLNAHVKKDFYYKQTTSGVKVKLVLFKSA